MHTRSDPTPATNVPITAFLSSMTTVTVPTRSQLQLMLIELVTIAAITAGINGNYPKMAAVAVAVTQEFSVFKPFLAWSICSCRTSL